MILLLAALLAATAPAAAATIEERSVTVTIDGAGFERADRLLVRLEEHGDLEHWQRYSIRVDEHIVLEECTAEVLDEGGAIVGSVPLRRHQRIESVGYGLHSSDSLSVISFPPLRVGQRLRISHRRRFEPLFPSASVNLDMAARQQSLRVVVRYAPGTPLVWRLLDAGGAFEVMEGAGELVVEATDVAVHDPPEHAPPADLAGPFLHLAWPQQMGWAEVGRWYQGLIQREQLSSQVGELAQRLCPKATPRRQCIEALAAHVKKRIRFEAVEIGVGGWVPTPPVEVLERGWGDCKDKSELLRSLLEAAGLQAYLVLIRAGDSGGIDPDFAWPFSFNHCIVAIADEIAEATPQDPVAGGFLFIDPSSDLGAVQWLTPDCQDRFALVVDGARSALVRVGERTDSEQRELVLRGAIDESGELEASVRLNISGARAERWLRDVDREPDERIAEEMHKVFALVFPGARVGRVRWRAVEAAVPGFMLEADLRLANAALGRPGRRLLRTAGLTAVPDARILDDRAVAVVLELGVHRTRWELVLPQGWCLPETQETLVDNAVGRFSATVKSGDDGTVVVTRRVELRTNQVEPESFADLRVLAAVENRTANRLLRLRCSADGS